MFFVFNATTIWRQILIALCILSLGSVSVVLASLAVHPLRRPLSPSAEATAERTAETLNSELEDVQISAPDGIVLRAWFVHPRNPNGDDVILLHGVGDNRLGMAGYAGFLLRHGYGVLLPDSRAHGISGGDVATYGLRESADISKWIDWLQATRHPSCVFGLGESMGAALLLQSLQTERRYCAVVAESPYATFREVAYDRVGQFFGLGPWVGRVLLRPVVELSFLYVRVRYHANLDLVDPEAAVAATPVPVLLIHGHEDNNIPDRHCELIAERDPTLVFWDVPGAGHTGAYRARPVQFETRILGWFTKHEHSGQERNVGSNGG